MKIDTNELVTAEQIASELGVKSGTLATWRSLRKGPSFVRVGRRAFYRRADVAAWLATQRFEMPPKSNPAASGRAAL